MYLRKCSRDSKNEEKTHLSIFYGGDIEERNLDSQRVQLFLHDWKARFVLCIDTSERGLDIAWFCVRYWSHVNGRVLLSLENHPSSHHPSYGWRKPPSEPPGLLTTHPLSFSLRKIFFGACVSATQCWHAMSAHGQAHTQRTNISAGSYTLSVSLALSL